MATLLKEKKFTGSFEIDISELNGCKGIVFIEVKPIKNNDALLLNDIETDIITGRNPYVLNSTNPIVSGYLRFAPTNSSDANIKSLVRYLLVK
ncbi:hypothetical protein [Tenacibaculum piscium]|uniref:hypothetical protein n=1 Tax=Tenacibaculum piscium TaxID=1458515 RepID=UPI00187B2D4E|nr:hypothetical protein [Tenacibaculum piscium]MBE7671562.1 hypothetical protein [Tenacibaculum piscium]MBE7690682.1 hypothetical protein [Tenacibaculum piscium]